MNIALCFAAVAALSLLNLFCAAVSVECVASVPPEKKLLRVAAIVAALVLNSVVIFTFASALLATVRALSS